MIDFPERRCLEISAGHDSSLTDSRHTPGVRLCVLALGGAGLCTKKTSIDCKMIMLEFEAFLIIVFFASPQSDTESVFHFHFMVTHRMLVSPTFKLLRTLMT